MAEVTVLPHSAAGDGGVLSAIGHEFDAHSFTYTSRDVILYALGGELEIMWSHNQVVMVELIHLVGATLSPDNQSELKFLYEGDDDFSVLPSFGVIPAQVVWIVNIIHNTSLIILAIDKWFGWRCT